MNSPWGTIYQIVADTGWTWHYVLWKVSRANIMLMMADRPSFKKQEEVTKKVTGKELGSQLLEKYR